MTYINENKFLSEIDKLEFIKREKAWNIEKLNTWEKSLLQALDYQPEILNGLKSRSELARQVAVIHDQLRTGMKGWIEKWNDSAEARCLADEFGDKAILLVFGKVNAGKSSFCNFVADRFSANGKSVQYFYIDAGRIIEMQEPFREGVTETTSRIQGVRLGEQLILLDTPGLHSVTIENGDLTKRFTDSADGVLWLTSSTSPGQVQELDALARELNSTKPLLPIITRSDVYEEDEVDGKIVKILCNKTPSNRQQQEDDVRARALEKLKISNFSAKLLSPTSVSAYVARAQDQTPLAMEDAGFEKLFEGLLSLIRPALDYKQRKAAEAMLHHLEENVLGTLRKEILPSLERMRQQSEMALNTLEQSLPHITSAVARAALASLPNLLEQHKSSGDVQAVTRALSTQIMQALDHEVQTTLAEYDVEMNASLVQLSPRDGLGFEDRSIEVEVSKGAAKRAAVGAAGAAAGVWAGAEAGALAGTALGSFIPIVGNVVGGTVGGIIGGILGGFLGGAASSKAGEYFEETEIQRRVVGVSYEKLHAALESEVKAHLPKLVAHAVGQCQFSVQQVMSGVMRLEDIIRTHEKGLESLKKEVRNDAV